MDVRDGRVTEVGHPAGTGRPLHRGADEVDRVRRRRRDHGVDLVLAHDPDRRGIAVRFHDTFSSGTSARRPSRRAWVDKPGEALLAVQLLGRLAPARAEVARPVHPRLGRHAQRLVAVDPLRIVGSQHVRLDPERRQVLRELQRTLNASAAGGGK